MTDFEARSLPGDGLTLSVRVRPGTGAARSGRGVLFLHGWPGTGADWEPVAARLADDPSWSEVTLVLPNLRGFGASQRPPVVSGDEPFQAFAPAAHGADLDALLDELHLDEVVVAGYDLGANLAQALARRSPQQVVGAVLFDPVHPAARAQAGRLNPAELWYQHFHCLGWSDELVGSSRANVEVYLRHFYTHWWGAGAVDEDRFAAVVDSYARPGAFAASIGWYRARASSRATEAAAAAVTAPLTTPIEVVWGEADPITPVYFAESIADSFTDAQVSIVPGVGHFGPLECPEQLAAAFGRLAARIGWAA